MTGEFIDCDTYSVRGVCVLTLFIIDCGFLISKWQGTASSWQALGPAWPALSYVTGILAGPISMKSGN